MVMAAILNFSVDSGFFCLKKIQPYVSFTCERFFSELFNVLLHQKKETYSFQMLCLSRVSVARPSITPADLLDASRLCLADANANMLHGKTVHLSPIWSFTSELNLRFLLLWQVCRSWSCVWLSPWSTSTTSMKESRSICRWFTTVGLEMWMQK